jgi:hypothetical protein
MFKCYKRRYSLRDRQANLKKQKITEKALLQQETFNALLNVKTFFENVLTNAKGFGISFEELNLRLAIARRW